MLSPTKNVYDFLQSTRNTEIIICENSIIYTNINWLNSAEKD